MTKKIIIDGIDLSELKAKAEALQAEQTALRASIAQGASKFVADAIATALAAVANMKAADTAESARSEAAIAYENLADAKFVAEVAGISYSLPYSDNDYSYGGFKSGEIISVIIDEDETGLLDYNYRDKEDPLYKLCSIAEDMESTVREWNSSYC